jgi:hypothetical protein
MERGGLCPPLSLSDLVAARRSGGLLPEAVAAVHWAIATRQEGDFCIFAALGTDGGMHLSRGSTIAAAVIAFGTTGLAAGRTTLRLVGVALFGVIGLIVSAEGERLTAVLTGESPILVTHR